jgi:hypothetical protein
MYNFNYDGSKFKLQIQNEQYFTNDRKKTVTVAADVRLVVPKFITNNMFTCAVPTGFEPGNELWFNQRRVRMTATARCLPGDVFDVDTGMKIARAKLESKAYTKFMNEMNRWLTGLQGFFEAIHAIGCDFIIKAATTSDYDKRYVKSVSTTELEKTGLI